MLAQGQEYACVYPLHYNDYSHKYDVYDVSHYPVNFTGQSQIANGSGEHLSTYDYLVAKGTAVTRNRCEFTFNHLCAVVKIKINLDYAHTLKNLVIHSNGTPFVTAGNVDLTAETPTIASTSTGDIELALGEGGNGISLTADNTVFTAYVITPAIDLSGTTLDISVDVDEKTYTAEGLAGKNLAAGGAFAFTFDYQSEYVDLGLPSGTLWARKNIGADKPEDYGWVFQWGDTQGYSYAPGDGKRFEFATYKYCNGVNYELTKYCTTASCGLDGFTDDKSALELSDDAAYVNWDSSWCVPTPEQFNELINTEYTTPELTTENGVYGLKVMKKSDSSVYVFLPAQGLRENSTYSGGGEEGDYWASTIVSNYPFYANCFTFYSSNVKTTICGREKGLPVRAVRR